MSKIPREHFPFGTKITEVECECGGWMYCVGMFCCCEKHKDFQYNPKTDGFTFYCPDCKRYFQLTLEEYEEAKKKEV